MSTGGRLVRGFATVGGWTMASRIMGFLRDICIAAFLGAGPVAEAFFIAFRLPNLFRRIFAEGAFNTAFVPMFSKRLETDGKEAAEELAITAMSALVGALIVLTLVVQLAMPWFIFALASGHAGTETFDLAVSLARITFPYIMLMSLAALLSGVLNAFGRFAAAAAAPVMLNVMLIGSVLLAALMEWNVGYALAIGVFISGFVQAGVVWYAVSRLGLRILPRRPRITPDVRRLVIIGVPAALAGGVVQINLLVGTQIASYFEGAIGWLWYADRIYQLPMGVIGIAVGIVLLPELSRQVRRADGEGGRNAVNRATEFAMLLTLPSATALIAIPEPLVSLLFERGNFTEADTTATAQALALYALGLPAFVLQRILILPFFAREDTKTPLRFACISMAVNLGISLALMPLLGFLSVAVGLTVATWTIVALLWWRARIDDAELYIDDRLRRRGPRMILAAIAMALCSWAMMAFVDTLPAAFETVGIIGVVIGSIAVYFGLALAFGASSMQDVKGALRRRAR